MICRQNRCAEIHSVRFLATGGIEKEVLDVGRACVGRNITFYTFLFGIFVYFR